MSTTEPLQQAFTTLSASKETVEQMAPNVMTAWQARPRALWREWLDVLWAAPLRNGAWVAAAAVVLFYSPLGSLISALLSIQKSEVMHAERSPVEPPREPNSEIALSLSAGPFH